ncbi:segregation and condensation protein A [Maledivibacter halophilus]|uniref:Segregation and condensation protein A n=1 Tax=Maledivibacter halophilus TaxID=36842 RepID=A0A1T5L9S5_9FIRM|nr:segregation/condensation protein A [Maledivibacter halophilus]SKC72731.1 condensin subunit ScpA [Maledivibacter halophilus]
MNYEVKLEAFEGPFDLLFHLIEKNEIDIYNIPISEVTEQYLNYLSQMKNLDMEVASEFLVMAATLLEIKSKMLLPNPIEEQLEFDIQGLDPRRDLVIKLIEYKKYKNIAEYFKHREDKYGKVHFKSQEQLEDFINKDMIKKTDLNLKEEVLIKSVNRVLQKINKMDINRKRFFKELKRDIYTVEDKISLLKSKLEKNENIKFDDLFNENNCRLEIVVTFLAVLELLKLKVIDIKQDNLFDEIYIFKSA